MARVIGEEVPIDEEQLRAFLRIKPTLEDTAAWFRCSARTIERYIRKNFDKTYVEFRHENMVHTRHDLIRKAISKAMNGDNVMLIFCLKNLCDWVDKAEVKDISPEKTFTLKYEPKTPKKE